ncbi:MAG: peptidoglycan-binding domain-containing protein [Patescibacteria group bacterium]
MKKYLIAIAFALAAAATASTVNAATTAEIMAQIAALQAQLGGTPAVSASHNFATDLTVGSTGASVTALQDLLISKGFLTIPAGTAKGYFGQLTKSAVAAWQASVGLPATGYFGPLSRAKVNGAGMVVIPGSGTGTVTCPTGMTCTPASNPSSNNGDEGQLVEIDNANDTESSVEEGDEEAYVVGAEVEAEDSDMIISRVDVDFTLTDASTGSSDNLDDYITEVSIFLDGKNIGTLDVDEADVNDGDNGDDLTDDDNDVYSFRFTGLNGKIAEGEQGEIYVAVTAANNIDSDDEDGEWAVVIPEDGIRAVDEAGITDTYVDSGDIDEETFSVGEADAGDLSVSVDSSDNESRTVSVDDENETEDVEVLSFTIESDSSENIIDGIEIDFATTSATTTALSEVIKSVRLLADGEEVASEDVTDGAIGGATVDFDDMDEVTIEEDEEVVFTVVVDLFETDGNYSSGYAFRATLDRSEIDAEDANGDEITVSGSDDNGGTITLRTTGIQVTVSEETDPESEILENTDSTNTDDQGKYEIEFVVAAFEDAAYIELGTVASGTTEANTGANFLIETTDNTAVAAAIANTAGSVLEHIEGGSRTGNFVKINDGDTATFRLTVYLDPNVEDSYRAQLYSVNFAATAVDATSQEVVTPEEDFESPSELVQN